MPSTIHTGKMQLKNTDSSGGVAAQVEPVEFKKGSSSLPLGQHVAIDSISGPTYATAQLLVQQIAYKLSDKIFSYSPETFDLDLAVKQWASDKENNIHGYATDVLPLQIRTGAGAFALGYIFSKDFDLSKRHIPQSLLAPSASIRHLREALDQLSLLYGVASPFVAHIAALDYSKQDGLVAEYGSALQAAEELGLALVSSSSAYETQHMAIFATLLAGILPTLHIYDGVRTARETLRIVDGLNEAGIKDVYNKVFQAVGSLNKRQDDASKVLETLKAFNEELGTDYRPFEYFGHEAPETVLVVFGSVESQIATQVVSYLAGQDKRVGAVVVRIYRPFIEEAFLDVLPDSVRQIAVFGQVHGENQVVDASVQSVLYSDVLTAVSFSSKWNNEPTIVDSKYAATDALTPEALATVFSTLIAKEGQTFDVRISQLQEAQQFSFWDVDNAAAVSVPTAVGHLLTKQSNNNISLDEVHDSVVQGGIVRTDIRSSKKIADAPYQIEEADVTYVGDENLLKDVDILRTIKENGKLVLRLPTYKAEDLEKRIPADSRETIQERAIELHVLDTAFSPAYETIAKQLVEMAFLKVAKPELSTPELVKLASSIDEPKAVQESVDALAECLHKVDVPESWAEVPSDFVPPRRLKQIKNRSFQPFQKEEPEEVLDLSNWEAAAKGLIFKEAYGTADSLRPDLTVKTFKITVKENRRLTPLTYDRNIFHIEFDLGDSGLTYQIGEALGIHADNDPVQVQDFIKFYGLNPEDIVQVPSREDPAVLETRTVYQSLLQNLDILGKPPKRFYEALAEFATDETEKQKLTNLGGQVGAEEFKQRSEVDTSTYVDILEEFQSARPSFTDLTRIVSPLKRREYSIASAQAVTPTSVALMIVVVDWVDPKGRTRFGQATRYLSQLPVGATVTASVKPSVMKLPVADTAPLIMAGLGTGLAPFRAFVQYRAMQKAQGKDIGAILLYMGSRHQREEYLYGEEWEAYVDAGVITLLGAAFSRDQPQKIYIQDRMRQTVDQIVQSYITDGGSFYLCGPTWPVPDVTAVLEEAIAQDAKATGRKVDPRKEIDRLKEDGRYVLEVY